MLYDSSNVLRGTTVSDLDRLERIERVLRIDTDRGEVHVGLYPWRASVDGTVLTETIRFQAVWPIMDRGAPCHFQCHGRLN